MSEDWENKFFDSLKTTTPALPEDVDTWIKESRLASLPRGHESADSQILRQLECLKRGRNLIERLARDLIFVEKCHAARCKEVADLQQHIGELEATISMANQHMLNDKAQIAEYENNMPDILTRFFQYWWNQPGSNTAAGAAEWWETELERIRRIK